MLSVVLPTHNELGLGYLPRIIDRITSYSGAELICVDNASTDGTAELLARQAERGALHHIPLPDSNRAQRLNAGLDAARHPWVLLHHPRSLLDPDALPALAALPDDVAWAGFTHAFDRGHPLLRWTSWYSNHVRHDRSGIVYLDHCIALNRRVVGEVRVPELEIFEDTAVSRLLRRRHGRPHRRPQRAVTSAVRYGHNGVWRQALMNQVLKVGYAAGVDHQRMNRLYERGLGLNNHGPDC